MCRWFQNLPGLGRCILGATISWLVWAPAALGYDLRALNLGDTSFFDGTIPPTGPGFYVSQYLELFEAHQLTDANGQKLPLPRQDVQLLAPMTQVIYVAPTKVLGIAHPGAMVLMPVLANAEANDGLGGRAFRAGSGMGDVIVGGFLSFDPIMGSNGPLLAQAIELDALLPTGSYDRKLAINPGSNFLSLEPFYAATLWLAPKWTISGRFHYLWNATNDAPSASFGPMARSTQAGQVFDMNLATHYQIDSTWGVGLNGYFLQQLTDTKVNGSDVPGRRERVFGLGPGMSIQLNTDSALFLNLYREFAAENRPQGTRAVARINVHF